MGDILVSTIRTTPGRHGYEKSVVPFNNFEAPHDEFVVERDIGECFESFLVAE